MNTKQREELDLKIPKKTKEPALIKQQEIGLVKLIKFNSG